MRTTRCCRCCPCCRSCLRRSHRSHRHRRRHPSPEELLLWALISTPRKAVSPMWTVEEPEPASIVLAMASAVSIGMAKPWVPDDWSLDWNEKPGGGRGVDPEHVARGVDERPARVPGLNVGVGLDETAQLLRRAVAVVTGGDRLVQRRHGPTDGAGGPAGAAGVADAHDVLDRRRRWTSCPGSPSAGPRRCAVAGRRCPSCGRSPRRWRCRSCGCRCR